MYHLKISIVLKCRAKILLVTTFITMIEINIYVSGNGSKTISFSLRLNSALLQAGTSRSIHGEAVVSLLGILDTNFRGRKTRKDLNIRRSTSTFASAKIVIDLTNSDSDKNTTPWLSTSPEISLRQEYSLTINTSQSYFRTFHHYKIKMAFLIDLPCEYNKKIHNVPDIPKVGSSVQTKT